MKKLLNEKQVLKKLEIDDFRHITKDKIIKMASILDGMEPEVAKKALEQFPEFSNTAKEILFNYKEILDKAIISNDESILSLDIYKTHIRQIDGHNYFYLCT